LKLLISKGELMILRLQVMILGLDLIQLHLQLACLRLPLFNILLELGENLLLVLSLSLQLVQGLVQLVQLALQLDIGGKKLLSLLVQNLNELVQVGNHGLEPVELGYALPVLLDEPVGAEGKVVRRAMLGDILHLLALAATVDEAEHPVADQLEGVAVGPAGAVVVAAGLGGGVHALVVDGLAFSAHVMVFVAWLVGSSCGGRGGGGVPSCQGWRCQERQQQKENHVCVLLPPCPATTEEVQGCSSCS
jgi:hypothetical protein